MALTITRAVPARGNDLSISVYTAMDGDEIVGRGGLAWGGGRCWIWLEAYHSRPSYARTLLVEARRLVRLAQAIGHSEVYTPRDAEYPTSEKLLRTLGFEQTDETVDGREIWVCRA